MTFHNDIFYKPGNTAGIELLDERGKNVSGSEDISFSGFNLEGSVMVVFVSCPLPPDKYTIRDEDLLT